jgi:adenosylhomocysteine nucleosidase
MSGREGLIVIATALPEEFEAVRVLESSSVRVVLTGDGPARASAALSTFEERSSPASPSTPSVAALIGAGVCGALSPELSPGDILVSSRILDGAGDVPAASAELVARAVAAGATPATFVTVSRPLVSSNEKRTAAGQAGAGGPRGAAAVDMESAGWARAAASRGVPFVVLRAVADTFEESLPSFLADCVNAAGSIDRSRVARKAALEPWTLPRLLALRARVRESAALLGQFLSRFLEAGPSRA